MIYKTEKIDIDYEKLGIAHKGKEAHFTTYIRDFYPEFQGPFYRPLVIICPGGGYEHHSPREAEPIALELMKRGFNVAVLYYSLAPNEFPCAVYEAAYTIAYVRQHAAEWDVNPKRIIVGGFSAGAHVAASLGTLWNEEELSAFAQNVLHCQPEDIRPDGMLLAYPVLTSGPHAHERSFRKLLGDRYDLLKDTVSLEKRVDARTPKTFLWHTFEDGSVPVENSMLFASALRKKNVPFELHIFPQGGHGMALGTVETDMKDQHLHNDQIAIWPELFEKWVENNL